MTTEETMTVTVTATATTTATVHAIMIMAAAATVAVTVETVNVNAIAIAAVTMKNGIMTVGVIVDAIVHCADVQGVGGGMKDPGHPGVVHVSFPQNSRIRSPWPSLSNPFL